jgi:hypothetical protein
MEVFVVLGVTFNEDSDVLGVFSTSEKARDFIDEHRIRADYFDECPIYDDYHVIVSKLV